MKCSNCGADIPDDAEFCPECGAKQGVDFSAMQTVGGLDTVIDGLPADLPPQYETLSPGTVFAERFEIEGTIGQGGMGVVYKAKDTVSEEAVALKLIRPERLSGEAALKKLIDEGVTTRKLRHPNIVAVYDVGVSGDQPYVSMEYVDGVSLRSWHRQKLQAREDVPLRVAARIIAEILDGLKAAHEAGVIHRDLKPENIVLLESRPTRKRRCAFSISGLPGPPMRRPRPAPGRVLVRLATCRRNRSPIRMGRCHRPISIPCQSCSTNCWWMCCPRAIGSRHRVAARMCQWGLTS